MGGDAAATKNPGESRGFLLAVVSLIGMALLRCAGGLCLTSRRAKRFFTRMRGKHQAPPESSPARLSVGRALGPMPFPANVPRPRCGLLLYFASKGMGPSARPTDQRQKAWLRLARERPERRLCPIHTPQAPPRPTRDSVAFTLRRPLHKKALLRWEKSQKKTRPRYSGSRARRDSLEKLRRRS